MTDRPPWYVRAWGWLLFALALLDLLDITLVNERVGAGVRPMDFAPTAAFAAGAIGLLSESRRGWFVGMLVGILGVGTGAWVLVGHVNGFDITQLGLSFAAVFVMLIPGVLLVWSLLTPRTRRWLREAAK